MLKHSVREVLYNKINDNQLNQIYTYFDHGYIEDQNPVQLILNDTINIYEYESKWYNYLNLHQLNLRTKTMLRRIKDRHKIQISGIFGVIFDEIDYDWPEKNYIRIELVQKTRKNHFLQLYNESNDTVRFWSKKRLTNSFIFYIFQSLFICAYFAVSSTNILLQYTANHKLYLQSFNKGITPYIKTIYNLNLKFNFSIIISKPNPFYINFQKKKFGSIKKSRKKLMYLFLPLQQPKLP